jgi:hypothetical protein
MVNLAGSHHSARSAKAVRVRTAQLAGPSAAGPELTARIVPLA